MRELARSKWAAIGAAVAVTLGAGGVSLTQAALDSGDKPVFVSIAPCRLLDTRPGDVNVGGRTTPLNADETIDLTITGSTGECTDIPTDAAGAALNVTAIAGSEQSFLTVYPADAAQPNASNLNWRGGDGPTPNKVDVKLSPDGAVKIFNALGTVHLAVDLVGYYIDHTHDDRYYTEAEVDAALAGKADSSALADKADASDVYTKSQVDNLLPADTKQATVAGWSFVAANTGTMDYNTGGCGFSTERAYGTVQLPVGAMVTGFSASAIDSSAGGDMSMSINISDAANGATTEFGTLTTAGSPGFQRTWAGSVTTTPTIGENQFVFFYVDGANSSGVQICGVQVDYTEP